MTPGQLEQYAKLGHYSMETVWLIRHGKDYDPTPWEELDQDDCERLVKAAELCLSGARLSEISAHLFEKEDISNNWREAIAFCTGVNMAKLTPDLAEGQTISLTVISSP